MKKFLLVGLVVSMLASVCFAVATNVYTVPRTNYTTAETTITFPWRTQAIAVINYAASNILMITVQGRTIEADPAVNPIIELNDIQLSSLKLRYQSGSGEAHVISLH